MTVIHGGGTITLMNIEKRNQQHEKYLRVTMTADITCRCDLFRHGNETAYSFDMYSLLHIYDNGMLGSYVNLWSTFVIPG